MHPCFFSQGPRFIALICLHPWSCEITLGHWTLKLDIEIGHWILKLDIGWNWILDIEIGQWNGALDIEIGHSPLKLDIQLSDHKWCSLSLECIDYCWTTKTRSFNCYSFCDLLISEGWIYWYNLSPLREVWNWTTCDYFFYPTYSVHFTSEILMFN